MSSPSDSTSHIHTSSSSFSSIEESGDEDPLRAPYHTQMSNNLDQLYAVLLDYPPPPLLSQSVWTLFLVQFKEIKQPLSKESQELWLMFIQNISSLDELEWLGTLLSLLQKRFVGLHSLWTMISNQLTIRTRQIVLQERYIYKPKRALIFKLKTGLIIILFLSFLVFFLYTYQKWIQIGQTGVDLW